jgi:hypothetical protein
MENKQLIFNTVNAKKICPACGGFKLLGATMRKDSTTKICSECALKEALKDWVKR